MRNLSGDRFGKARVWPLAFGLFVSLLLVVTPILAASYTITVQTDKSSYSDANTILITGKVTPAPGPNTAVFVDVKNPNGKDVDFGSESVDPTTGAYSHNTVSGGGGPLASLWKSGTYTVNASWGSSGTAIFQTTTFAYNASVTTTTSSTTTTSTSSSTTTTTTSTSSTTTSTSSTIPEFNPQAVLVVSLIAMAAAAVIGRAKLMRGPVTRV